MTEFLASLGIEESNAGGSTGQEWLPGNGKELKSISPIDGEVIATVRQIDEKEYEAIVQKAREAFITWRMIPAPRRGEIVRQIALKLREYKKPLGRLVTLERLPDAAVSRIMAAVK